MGQFWPNVTGRRYFAETIFNHYDVIGLQSYEFGEITQNKGYYAVQGHSRSPMSVPIESPYATSYNWLNTWHLTYSVSQKSSPPKKKPFAIFSLRLSIFPWNYAISLPVYIHTCLPIFFCQFILIFKKMALIFLRVLVVFTVSRFNKSDCQDFIANDEWPQFTQLQSTGLSDLQTMLES